MKQTQGEWEVGISDIIGTGNDRHHIVVGLKENHHKIIASTGFASASDEDESITNAHLISAAPDMYVVLKNIISGFGHKNPKSKFWEFTISDKYFEDAKKALAKAEGKQ
jgi:hypothetical protein